MWSIIYPDYKYISSVLVTFVIMLTNNKKLSCFFRPSSYFQLVITQPMGYNYPFPFVILILGVVVTHCHDNWLRTGRYRVQYPGRAKSLTPGFALINHFFEMINSVRIDCCSETWLKLSLNSFFTFINWKSSNFKTQLSVKI